MDCSLPKRPATSKARVVGKEQRLMAKNPSPAPNQHPVGNSQSMGIYSLPRLIRIRIARRFMVKMSWFAWVLCGTFIFAGIVPAFSREGDERAKQIVQEALKAESKGLIKERRELLEHAGSYDKHEEAAGWLSGKVKVGNAWLTYEELVAANEKSPPLKQYLAARDEAKPTVGSQESLATMCQKLRLKEQEQAHWRAVLQLAPDHSSARKSLGFTKDPQGKWILVTKEQDQLQQRVTVALKSEKQALAGLARKLQHGTISVDKAAEEMAKSGDPALIPAWEQHVSATSIAGALAVVATLDKLTAPEASHSLLRHALYHPDQGVQTAAIAALKTRDEQSYLPPLIAGLRGPWVGEARTAYDPITRQRVTRYVTISEKQDAKDMQVIDDIYQLGGDIRRAGGMAAVANSTNTAVLEAQRVAANAVIDAQNQRLMTLLEALTDQENFTTPQDWWKWWEEHCESITVGEKTVEASYAYRTSTVYAQPPVPRSTGSRTSPSRNERHECLAAGTLILTNRGPIGVEQIRLGDLVLARHPATGETLMKPVVQTTHRPPEKLLQISFGENMIRASGGHPFWISGQGWIRARNIKSGMIIHGLSQPAEVTSVFVEEEASPSFNLIVDDFHSYFVQVGEIRVLSHDNSMQEPIRTTVPGLVQPLKELRAK